MEFIICIVLNYFSEMAWKSKNINTIFHGMLLKIKFFFIHILNCSPAFQQIDQLNLHLLTFNWLHRVQYALASEKNKLFHILNLKCRKNFPNAVQLVFPLCRFLRERFLCFNTDIFSSNFLFKFLFCLLFFVPERIF